MVEATGVEGPFRDDDDRNTAGFDYLLGCMLLFIGGFLGWNTARPPGAFIILPAAILALAEVQFLVAADLLVRRHYRAERTYRVDGSELRDLFLRGGLERMLEERLGSTGMDLERRATFPDRVMFAIGSGLTVWGSYGRDASAPMDDPRYDLKVGIDGIRADNVGRAREAYGLLDGIAV